MESFAVLLQRWSDRSTQPVRPLKEPAQQAALQMPEPGPTAVTRAVKEQAQSAARMEVLSAAVQLRTICAASAGRPASVHGHAR